MKKLSQKENASYRRGVVVVVGVIEPADGHPFVVAIKCACRHFGDCDSSRNITELDGKDRIVAFRVAVVVDPDGLPSHACNSFDSDVTNE